MGKHRVYEIAKELGKTNQEVIDILAKNNIQVKSTLSTVDDTVRRFGSEKLGQEDLYRRRRLLLHRNI